MTTGLPRWWQLRTSIAFVFRRGKGAGWQGVGGRKEPQGRKAGGDSELPDACARPARAEVRWGSGRKGVGQALPVLLQFTVVSGRAEAPGWPIGNDRNTSTE